MSTIGNNIKRRREELGYTQEELAEKLGYKSKSTITKIEMGINDITQTKISAFAKVLKTTPSYIMGWDNEESTDGIHKAHVFDLDIILTENSFHIIMCIGNILKNERIKKDLTEKTVSSMADISLDEYLKLENEYVNIGSDKIERIVVALGIDFNFFYGFLSGFSFIFDTVDNTEGDEIKKEDFKDRLARKANLTD